MGFSRQDYWSGLPVPSPGDLPGPGTKPGSPTLQADSLPSELPRNPHTHIHTHRRRQWHPTPVLLPGKSHGRRSLVGCSPWGCEELGMTERLHFHFSLLCIGEGNGKPLQCSCLENPRDGVAQSRTRLEWLSSSICKYIYIYIYIHTHIYNIYIAYINIYICIHTKSWSTVSELQRSKRGHWICYR